MGKTAKDRQRQTDADRLQTGCQADADRQRQTDADRLQTGCQAGADRQRQTDADRLPGRCRQAEADRSGAAAAGRGR